MSGHSPPKGVHPPTRESFHLGIARDAFARGALTGAELERSIEHVLGGGHLNSMGRIPEPNELPSLPDPDLARSVEM